MKSKNHEPSVVVTSLDNGLTGYFVPLKGEAPVPVEAFGPNAQLFLVDNPADALRPPTLKIDRNMHPREIMARVAANPRANLFLE